jgi:predicted Zn-dependent peptidase
MNRIHIQKFLLVLAASILAAAPSFAQKQTPPAGSAPKAFTVPAHETYSLPNGMKVTLVPYGALPKVTASLVVRAGSIHQTPDQYSVTSILGSLLKEGTTTRSAKQLAEEFAQMGGDLNVGIGEDESSFTTDVLSEFGPIAVKLLADVSQHPLLPESELARLKNDAVRQVTVARSIPQQIAQERFRKILYPDHPYGRVLPAPEDIQKQTIENAKAFYQGNFVAARAHLYIAGRFDGAAVKKAIAEGFSGWAKGTPAASMMPKPQAKRILDVTDRPGAAQSTIYVGLPVPGAESPDNIALGVTNVLLGGSFGSRITANIREQKGYTYSPNSQISRRVHDAYWVETADVTTAATGPSLKEIFGEVERLQKEAPGAAELQGIQSYISGLFVIQNSSRGALIGQLRFVDLQGLGEDYLKTYVQKVNAVTPADVQRMTAQYLKADQMTIVVVGDKAKITEQLALYAAAGDSNK